MRRQRTSRQFAKKSSEKIGIARVREVPNLNIFRIKGALPSGESAFFCLASRPYFPAVSLRSQSAGWLWRSVPYGRTVSFFSHLCSGSVRRRKSIPCFGKLRSAALVHGKGGAETMGFCRRSFEEVSRFPCHNVAGNRLTRRCRLSAAIGRKMPSGGKTQKHPNKITAPPPQGGGAVIS